MAATSEARLSFSEKFGYSLADGAAQFVFLTMVLFQQNFYTDTLGISAGWAGTLVLIARLWDAFFDPVMGFIADRTKTRWGRFRPWILWTSLPWGVCMVLAYSVPGFGSVGTFLFALVTNMALMTLYSMNNTPYSALMAVMTGSVSERTRLSQYRFITAMVGQLIVGGFTLAIVSGFSTGHFKAPPTEITQAQLAPMTADAQAQISAGKKVALPTIAQTPAYLAAKRVADGYGWQMTMGIFAVICVACFLATFLTVRERIEPDPQQKSSVKADLSVLVRSGPWAAMFLVTVTHYILSQLHSGMYIYYFKYVLDKGALANFVHAWGLPSIDPNNHSWSYWWFDRFKLVVNPDNLPGVVNGILQITLKVCSVIGIIAASALVMRFNKKAVVMISLTLNAVAIIGLYFVPYTNIWGVFTVEWLGALAYAPTIPLLWVLFADVVDYTEWKTGRRITGLIYATFFFALKAGLSLGGALAGWVLSAFGYDATKEITASAVTGIVLTLTIIPGIVAIGCAACMLMFRITKQMNHEIAEELAARRARAAEAAMGTTA